MQTVFIKDQDYKGPTVHAHGETMDRLTDQFKNVRSPQQLKRALKAWGLADMSPRQARFWSDCKHTERRIFCDIAQVTIGYANQEWQQIPPPQREKLWRAVNDAAGWGERLKGRF